MHMLGMFALLALAVLANLVLGKPSSGIGRPETWAITLALFAGALALAGYTVRTRWDGIFIDRENRISLSRFQLVLWTVVLISALLTAGITNALLPGYPTPLEITIPEAVWGLLGLGAFSATVAPAIKGSMREAGAVPASAGAIAACLQQTQKLSAPPTFEGRVMVKAAARDARWVDLIMGDCEGSCHVDVSKIQQLVITLVLVVIYAMGLWGMMGGPSPIKTFPPIDGGFVALLGISHAAYLADKQLSKT